VYNGVQVKALEFWQWIEVRHQFHGPAPSPVVCIASEAWRAPTAMVDIPRNGKSLFLPIETGSSSHPVP